MDHLEKFKKSVENDVPNAQLSLQLKALWYDFKGDWNQAHQQVDQLNDFASAEIHAYLHRKEGDLCNADYWYSKSKKSRPSSSLDQEWEQLVLKYL